MIRIVEFHVGLSQGTPIPEDHHGVSILGLRVGLNKGKALTPQAIFVPIEIASLGTNSICKTHPNPLFIAWMCAKLHFFMVKPRSTWYAAWIQRTGSTFYRKTFKQICGKNHGFRSSQGPLNQSFNADFVGHGRCNFEAGATLEVIDDAGSSPLLLDGDQGFKEILLMLSIC